MILEKILLVLFLDVTITSELFVFTYLFYTIQIVGTVYSNTMMYVFALFQFFCSCTVVVV